MGLGTASGLLRRHTVDEIVSAIESWEPEINPYITLDAHSTSRGAILKVRIGAERVGDDVPNVRAVEIWTVSDHA